MTKTKRRTFIKTAGTSMAAVLLSGTPRGWAGGAYGSDSPETPDIRFGMIEGEPREYGGCDFEVDGGLRRAEPRPEIRGDIARISFYMERTYGVPLSDQQRRLFEVWNREDPPDAREIDRNERIRRIQGSGNPFVEDYGEEVARR